MQFSGAFWATLQRFNMSNHAIDQLLSKETTSLEDVLNEDSVVQEVRNQNSKLFDFFTVERLEGLLDLITVFPEEDAGVKRTQNHPFIAAEILGESSPIHDKILENEQLICRVLQFIGADSLNSTLLGYYSKLVVALLSRNFEKTAKVFAESKLEQLIKHLGHRSILDIVSKILTNDQAGIVDVQKELVKKVFAAVQERDEWVCINSALLIADLVYKITDLSTAREVLREVLSDSSLKQLFGLLHSESSFKVVATIEILKSLYASSSKIDLTETFNLNLSSSFIQSLEIINNKLNQEEGELLSTIKAQSKVLGEGRLKLTELISLALKKCSEELASSFAESQLPETILRLFFEFPWHSMLHKVVDSIIQETIHSGHEKLVQRFLCNELLVKNILALKETNQVHRLGHLGHVHRFANYLNDSSNLSIKEFLQDNKQWGDYTKQYLKKRNKFDKKQLGQIGKTEESSSKSESASKGELKEEPVQPSEQKIDLEGFGEIVESKISEESKDENYPGLVIEKPVRKQSDGCLSPSNDPEFNHVNYWTISLKIDEIEEID